MMFLAKAFFRGMKEFGESIAFVVNFILLTFVYLVGVGIPALIAKIVGKHFLETKLEKKSYWKDLNVKKRPMEEYYRQF